MIAPNYSHQKKTLVIYTPLSGMIRVEYLLEKTSSA